MKSHHEHKVQAEIQEKCWLLKHQVIQASTGRCATTVRSLQRDTGLAGGCSPELLGRKSTSRESPLLLLSQPLPEALPQFPAVSFPLPDLVPVSLTKSLFLKSIPHHRSCKLNCFIFCPLHEEKSLSLSPNAYPLQNCKGLHPF